ncbi:MULTISPECIES: GSU2403 family nucleotidyltransferase fold protein [unclassified Paracoccus (in: a-proteobacteria)]|uniref:nucleotidyltransferase family protein n=1 Tax=unclassified Paracoccus (in: a-proteobacteria) TaxID=2688777 RepID=UPI00048B67C8|nr:MULTISPECIES: GSU2403 family nucleotidyltransferase fold protein [unclassified Paracoccus (in: a-proteobacteria)]
MAQHLSAVAVAAWTDLLRHLKDAAVSELRGTPRLKKVGQKGYWYDHFRIGDKTVDRYIGEDGEELRARLARQEALREAERQSQRERSRLMRILRAEGCLMTDRGSGQVISAMARAGVFRLGGTLVGTQAFRCYEGELGIRIGFDQTAMTDDIDIASFERLSLVLGDQVTEPLAEVFRDLRFDPLPSLEGQRVWRWRQGEQQTLVEFLTPCFDGTEGLRDLPALGVSAQSLHYLNFLIAQPIRVPLLYRAGFLIQVPRPERYAIHKLIVADRRREGPDALKARKDRAQAEFLIEALAEERPEDLRDAYETAMGQGPSWRARLAATLARMPHLRDRLQAL